MCTQWSSTLDTCFGVSTFLIMCTSTSQVKCKSRTWLINLPTGERYRTIVRYNILTTRKIWSMAGGGHCSLCKHQRRYITINYSINHLDNSIAVQCSLKIKCYVENIFSLPFSHLYSLIPLHTRICSPLCLGVIAIFCLLHLLEVAKRFQSGFNLNHQHPLLMWLPHIHLTNFLPRGRCRPFLHQTRARPHPELVVLLLWYLIHGTKPI